MTPSNGARVLPSTRLPLSLVVAAVAAAFLSGCGND